ncbi:MAG: metal-dependent hydrolase [Planctomycetota bacterium]
MADFKTHVTFSSSIGAGYAVVASGLGFDLSTSLVAGGLCGVSGMLPDVDSDSGVPRREALGFAAAIVPMLLMDRFRQFHLSHDQVVLLAAGVYFAVRFLAADLIGRWSVHRGMWPSIPAVMIFAGLAFLMSAPTDVFDRYLKAIAVGLGALSHLILDEVYSVDTRGVVPRFKKSFGTAVKLFSKDPWANFSTYAKLAAVTAAILMEPMVLDRVELRSPELAGELRGAKDRLASLPRPGIADRLRGATEALTERVESAEPIADKAPALTAPAATAPWGPGPPPSRPPSPWFAPPGAPPSGAFTPSRNPPPAAPPYGYGR